MSNKLTDERVAALSVATNAWLNVEYARMAVSASELGSILTELRTLRAQSGWQPIETAPKDGTPVALWMDPGSRISDAYWGRPEHSCGEFGGYCDSCPSYDGWVDVFGYITGPEGHEDGDPTHWRALHTPPASEPTNGQ